MNNLLLDEYPLLIMPKLATKIGLNESIVLQQIHYWNEINKKANNNFKDGYYWTYNSYDKWQEQFPFWSLSTIKRTIKKLEDLKLVVTGNYNKLKIDRTKWYRIDYNVLEKVDICEFVPLVQNEPINVSKRTNQDVRMNKPLPEIKPKITTKIKNIGSIDKQRSISFNSFLSKYNVNDDIAYYIMYYLGYNNEKYTIDKWCEIVNNLDDIELMSSENIEELVRKYLNTNFKDGKHSLYHSSLPQILEYRMKEVGII